MSFPFNFLLSKSNGLPSCINIDLIPYPDASHSTMNVLPKSGVANTSVEDMASFKRENFKVASSFHANEFFFKKYVSGVVMHA